MVEANGIPSKQHEVVIPAVILAASGCDNLLPLTNDTPKALITVGNRTLVAGTIDNLVAAGVKQIHVFVSNGDKQRIEEHLNMEFTKGNSDKGHILDISVHSVGGADASLPSTSQVIKRAAQMLQSAFIVVPCDLYGTFNLQGLIKNHFSSERLCTIALMEDKQDARAGKKGKEQADDQIAPGGNPMRGWGYKYKVMATLDVEHSQIVGIAAFLTLTSGESYDINKWTLRMHPKCTVRCDLYDPHIYVFSKHIIDVLNAPSLEQASVRLDLIPYIIKRQDAPLNITSNDQAQATALVQRDNMKNDTMRIFQFPDVGDALKCCRVNSIETYMKVSMQRCFDKEYRTNNSSIEATGAKIRDVLNGAGCKVGVGTNVKASILGENVVIGKGCTLSKCVIMNNVTLEDNVVLDRCILAEGAIVSTNVTLKHVVVAPKHTVPSNTRVECDFLPSFIEPSAL
ncbi:translation initiation factor EIF-2B gamma [Babesia ovis]|uniref:Translation initiation factor eIF2B subunit gamma n=1 Tax=Babesia ovis TaxID=5869 RepID=A0A9W5TDI0_BABOV|nr:translation initiation factor EIF-2B gamma [Babesia ovis]